MEIKEEYIAFCNQHDWVPIFHRPFWWDSVTDSWDVEKISSGNQIAYLPYTTEKKLGFTLSRNPHLTPYSGLLFKEKDYSKSQKQELFLQAENFLSRFSLSEYDCSPLHTSDIIKNKSKSTFLLELNTSTDEIYDNFKSSLKRQLKKAEKNLKIKASYDVNAFYSIYTDSIKKQKGSSIVPKEKISEVMDLCIKKHLGSFYFAEDEEGNIHAAIFNVSDTNCSYYLLGGSNSIFLGSGAMGLLLWHCIQLAHTKNKKYFDFEGSEVSGVARFFSTFGGEQIEYPILSAKTDSKLSALLLIKNKLLK